MNIKELVLVISILLSIRIAEYAMKKYKEQKDVEVTKKQKSRKQTKKYIITAPETNCQGLFNQIHKKSTKKVPEALYGS